MNAALVLATSLALTMGTLQDPRPEERGFPLLRVHDDTTHGGSPQNFGVAVDPRGYLYVGNLHGLLLHDGTHWRLIESKAAIYATCVSARSAVITGGPGTLDLLESDETGTPRLKSLLGLLPETGRAIGDVRRILAAKDGFVILTERRLLFYDGHAISSLAEFDAGMNAGIHAARGIVFLTDGGPPRKVEGRSLVPAPEIAGLTGRRIDALAPGGADGGYVAAVRDRGLVRVTGVLETPVRSEVSDWAARNLVRDARRLPDGRLLLASMEGGLAIALDENRLEQVVDSEHGLPDNSVADLAEDAQGGVWAAFSNGIVRLDLGSPLTVFDRRANLLGTSNDTFRIDGRLYVSASSGLSRLFKGRLSRVRGISGSVWHGIADPTGEGDAIVAAASGLYRIENDRASLLPGTADLGAYALAPLRASRDLLVGARTGLFALRAEPGRYRLEGPFQGSPRYVRDIVVRSASRAFVATVFDGVQAVDLGTDGTAAFTRLGAHETGMHVSGNTIRVISSGVGSEIFTIDESGPRLVKDEARTRAVRGLTAWVSATDAASNLWINSVPPRVFPSRSGALADEPVVLHGYPMRSIQSIFAEDDGVVWLAGETGLFRHAGPVTEAKEPPHAPAIATVRSGERKIFDHWGGRTLPASLPTDGPRLHVELAPLSHERGLSFQFRMDPVDGEFSEWSSRTDVEYTSLQPGRYQFRARTRGADGQVSPEALWSFDIAPRWHRSLAAQLLWIALAALLVAFLVRLRTRALERQAVRLGERVLEKTRDLQDAVHALEDARSELEERNRQLEAANARLENVARHDALTGLANRRQFDESLASEWARARRLKLPLALGMIDLDHFKALNDTFGHPEGDEALRKVARVLEEAIQRTTDIVARYGGEEFVFLLPGTDVAGGRRMAEDIRARIASLGITSPGGPSAVLTASIGVAVVTPSGDLAADELVECADRALYEAKAGGRDQVLAVEVAV